MTYSDTALQNSNGSPNLGAGSQDGDAGLGSGGIQPNLTPAHSQVKTETNRKSIMHYMPLRTVHRCCSNLCW